MLPGNAGFTKKAHFLNCRFEKPDTTVHGHLAVEGHERLYPVSQNGNSVSAFFGTTCTYFYVVTSVKTPAR